jgi:hypothetical protein
MTSITRNDVQSVVDQARNRLIDFVASRQDMQILQDTVKGLTSIMNQQHNLLRQEENQYVQLVRRMSSLESRFMQVEREIQQLNRTLTQVAGQSQRFTERVIVTRPGNQTGYVYSAA